MITMKSDRLDVPGASLYYEVRGSGPVLLMIPGGPADGGGFEAVAGLLADRYSVVIYDPRGLSRSRLDTAPEQPIVELLAEDAYRLLAALGTQPALVFGTSGGGIVGLELVLRHPGRVRTLVVHEPAPATALLADGARVRTAMKAACDTYREAGVWAGMQAFLAAAGLEAQGGPRAEVQQSAEMAEAMAGFQRNAEFFLAHYLLPVADYVPDIAALRATPTQIVVAVGDEPREDVAYRTGVALSERLGMEPVVLPGDHGGFRSHVEAFAQILRAQLERTTDR